MRLASERTVCAVPLRYVALEFLEMVFGNADVVDAVAGGVLVYADGSMGKPVALVQPNLAALRAWYAKQAEDGGGGGGGGSGGGGGGVQTLDGDAALCASPAAQAFVLASLNEEGLRSGLARMSLLGGVRLVGPGRPWTPANGCLTATNKVQRRAVAAAHPAELAELIQGQQLTA